MSQITVIKTNNGGQPGDHRLRAGNCGTAAMIKSTNDLKKNPKKTKHVSVMNLKFAKVQSVFPLEPISARVLCLHCHQMTNARENARRSPPTTQMVMRRNGESQLSSQTPWVLLLRPRVLRMPTLVTSGINPLSSRRRIASLVPLDTPLTASLSPCVTSQIHFSLPKPPPPHPSCF